MPYDPKHIEPKWQQYREANRTFAAEVDPTRPKFYVLDMFPYPSGEGLHVGHPEGDTRQPTSSRATSACVASMSCTPWAGTLTACRRSAMRCARACIRPSPRSA